MSKMKAVQVPRKGGEFEVVSRDIPEPGRGEVRIKVAACGVCHSDLFVKEGVFPGTQYPRIPGHEVTGTVDHVGPEVSLWKVGDRVGVGWHGGHCFVCTPCREGDFINCQNGKIAGITFDGGYAEYMVAPQDAVARMPEGLDMAEAAPLLCAGVTTFNALRNSGARGGDLVAVDGIGGLGHLAVQFAAKMGLRVAAISGGSEKEKLARDLGARHYIDSKATTPANELQRMGGARVIVGTAPSGKALSALVDGLAAGGRLVVLGIGTDPITVTASQLVTGRRTIVGWPSGDAKDSEDTLAFSELTGVRPMIETFPLQKAAEAFDRMMKNQVRFRAVLKIA